MARKSFIIEEPEYHGGDNKSTITYYDLMIQVTLHRSVASFKVSLADNISHKSHLNLTANVLTGFRPEVFNSM